MASNNVDDYDDFNSFLETVLSDCDEPPATKSVSDTAAVGPKDDVDTKIDILREECQEASTTGGVGHAADGGDVAAVSLTAADLDSACTTGVSRIPCMICLD